MPSFLDKYKIDRDKENEEKLKKERETIRQKRKEGEFERGFETEPERPEPIKREEPTESFLEKYKKGRREEIKRPSVEADTPSREMSSITADRDARDDVRRDALKKRTEQEKPSFSKTQREISKSSFLGTDTKKITPRKTSTFKELDTEFKKASVGKTLLADGFKGSRFFGTDAKTDTKISDNPFIAGFTPALPIIGAGVKRDAPEELDLAQEKAKVLMAWKGRKNNTMAQSSFLGTDVGKPFVYDIPAGIGTTYDLVRVLGGAVTYGLASGASKVVGGAAGKATANLASKVFPLSTKATIDIVRSIQTSGASMATFRGITGSSEDMSTEEMAENVLKGYFTGIMFGTVANANEIFKEVMGTVRDDLQYFGNAKNIKELTTQRNSLAFKWRADRNRSNLKKATNKMTQINKDYDIIKSEMLKKIDK